MDNQVKFFSSGMLVRLGFAVAVHVDPDVLLIDEVLAVGDEAFQKKCLDKIRSFQAEGRTIVLVTHALDTVVAVCGRAVMLEHGKVHMQGTPMDVVAELRHRLLRTDPNFVAEEGTREVEIEDVEILPGGEPGHGLKPGQDLVIQVDLVAHAPVTGVDAAIAVVSAHTNEEVLVKRTSENGPCARARCDGRRRVRFRVPATEWVGGKYFVSVGLEASDGHPYHIQTQRYSFEAIEAERLPVPLRRRRRRRGRGTVNGQPPVTDPEAHDASLTSEGKNRAMLIALILASVLLAALAQLTLKHGMNQVTAESGTATSEARVAEVDGLERRRGRRARDLRAVGRHLADGAVAGVAVLRLPVRVAELPGHRARGQVRAGRDDPAAALGGRPADHGRHRAGGADAVSLVETGSGVGGASTVPVVDPAAAELAVVIVNYNTGAYLTRCLASLAEHRGDIAMDVLVIDNASEDDSHREAIAAHPWARLIENPTNVFLSPAWNQGVRETSAPYVLLLNPDAEWWSGTLAGYVAVARDHPRAGIVGPRVLNPDGTVYASGRSFPSVRRRRGPRLPRPGRPSQPLHAPLPAGGLGPHDRARGGLGERLLHADASDRARGGGSVRRGVPPLRRGARHGVASARRRAGRCGSRPSPRSSTRSACRRGGRAARCTMHSDSIYRYYRKHRAAGLAAANLAVRVGGAAAARRVGVVAREGSPRVRGPR